MIVLHSESPSWEHRLGLGYNTSLTRAEGKVRDSQNSVSKMGPGLGSKMLHVDFVCPIRSILILDLRSWLKNTSRQIPLNINESIPHIQKETPKTGKLLLTNKWESTERVASNELWYRTVLESNIIFFFRTKNCDAMHKFDRTVYLHHNDRPPFAVEEGEYLRE